MLRLKTKSVLQRLLGSTITNNLLFIQVMQQDPEMKQIDDDCENLSGPTTLFRAGLSVVCFSVALEGMLPQWANICLGAMGLFLFSTAVTGTCLFRKLFDADHK